MGAHALTINVVFVNPAVILGNLNPLMSHVIPAHISKSSIWL
ncbi:hypothetical protein Xvie_04051 [Xenorhabdus vietnamensis]|uniref:Uncharacterized protein n=1 Tax=Xenorhabdus vietnamensis TaxID=351656 RepID=A0A1Y2S8L8_9GAMM|nr:hypothetical protein Xvie_04051 [Xenorhabdus vietnamensis]